MQHYFDNSFFIPNNVIWKENSYFNNNTYSPNITFNYQDDNIYHTQNIIDINKRNTKDNKTDHKNLSINDNNNNNYNKNINNCKENDIFFINILISIFYFININILFININILFY